MDDDYVRALALPAELTAHPADHVAVELCQSGK